MAVVKTTINTTAHFLQGKKPRIVIPYDVHNDIKEIVNGTFGEVGWIGEAVREPNNVFRVLKVTIPEQEANSGTTEISADGIMKIDEEEPEFNMDNFKLWSHSHHNMGVSPSGQDKTQMLEFAKMCDDWFIGTIHNKRDEVHGYIVLGGYLYVDDIEVIFEDSPEIMDLKDQIVAVEKDFDDRIKKLEDEKDEFVSGLLDSIKEHNKNLTGSRDWKDLIKKRVKHKGYGTYKSWNKQNNQNAFGYGAGWYKKNQEKNDPKAVPEIRKEPKFLIPPKINEIAKEPFFREHGVLYVMDELPNGAKIKNLWIKSLLNPDYYYELYPQYNLKKILKNNKPYKLYHGELNKINDAVDKAKNNQELNKISYKELMNYARRVVSLNRPIRLLQIIPYDKWTAFLYSEGLLSYDEGNVYIKLGKDFRCTITQWVKYNDDWADYIKYLYNQYDSNLDDDVYYPHLDAY